MDPGKILLGIFPSYPEVLLLLTVLVKKEIICSQWSTEDPSAVSVWRRFLYFAQIEHLLCKDIHQYMKFSKC